MARLQGQGDLHVVLLPLRSHLRLVCGAPVLFASALSVVVSASCVTLTCAARLSTPIEKATTTGTNPSSMSSSISSLSDPPSLAEAVVARWEPKEYRHVNHGSTVRFGPKPLTVKLLHRLDLDIHFSEDTAVPLLVEELHEHDEKVSVYIDLHSQEALSVIPEPYSSEATLSHRIEAVDGHLMRWLLNTHTFRNTLAAVLPGVDEGLTCHWETFVNPGQARGRTDKVILHEQLSPKIVAAGEWKTSLSMDDEMRALAASLSRSCRTAQTQHLDALKVFVVGTGHTAQLEVYTYAPSYPPAIADTVQSLSTLISDAWAYGDVWDARIPVVTHDGAWGFSTRPGASDLDSGTEVAQVALAVLQPSMGLWLAASALSDLKARVDMAGSWEMEDELDDTPESLGDSDGGIDVTDSTERLSSLSVDS